nr:hypothetical protein [Stenotrophomonas maltophilia]
MVAELAQSAPVAMVGDGVNDAPALVTFKRLSRLGVSASKATFRPWLQMSDPLIATTR